MPTSLLPTSICIETNSVRDQCEWKYILYTSTYYVCLFIASLQIEKVKYIQT